MNYIKKCLFPAAGYGTRFLPATKSIPKEMLPVLDKPLIHYGVEEALEAGLSNINIILGRGKSAIEDYFDKNYELETEIAHKPKKMKLLNSIHQVIEKGTFTFRRQGAMLGLGDAIFKAQTMIGDEPFGVILADDICDTPNNPGVMKQMVEDKEAFDVVILDPPAFTQTEDDVKNALRAYASLNYLGIKLAKRIFVTCSCSHHVDKEMFKKTVISSAFRAKKELIMIDYKGQAPDHPISIANKNLEYLKCIFFYVKG